MAGGLFVLPKMHKITQNSLLKKHGIFCLTFSTMKNREKGLDIPLNIRYDNQVRVVEAFLRADTAMNREIAPQGGNFRGVCPIIGRLRSPVCGVDRHTMGQVPATVPVFFMSRNDTHG